MFRNFLSASSVVFLSAFLCGCQSAPPLPPDQSSLLDGTWKLVAYECDSGGLNEHGIKVSDAIKKGETSLISKVSGQKVSTVSISGHCQYDIQEHWAIGKKGALLISNTTSQTSILPPAPAKHSCDEYQRPETRQHTFSLNGNTLQILLSDEHTIGQTFQEVCDFGRTIMDFVKVTAQP